MNARSYVQSSKQPTYLAKPTKKQGPDSRGAEGYHAKDLNENARHETAANRTFGHVTWASSLRACWAMIRCGHRFAAHFGPHVDLGHNVKFCTLD